MSDIDNLIDFLKEKNVWRDLKLTKKEFKKSLEISMNDEAKGLVADAFRNNPCLENLHSEDKISQEEMKTIMKYAVNRIYYWLWLKENSMFLYNMHLKLTHLIYSDRWDNPDIDVEKELQKNKDVDELAAKFLICKATHNKKNKEGTK